MLFTSSTGFTPLNVPYFFLYLCTASNVVLSHNFYHVVTSVYSDFPVSFTLLKMGGIKKALLPDYQFSPGNFYNLRN